MKRALLLCAMFVICAIGCGRSQWLVRVTTDATTPAWGDRLLLEVLDDSGEVVSRLDRSVIDADFPVSFGVAPPGASDAKVHVRGRLYQSALVGADGLPTGTQMIDALAFLPNLDSTRGETPVVLFLISFCFGQPADVANQQSCYLQGTDIKGGPEQELVDALLDPHELPGGIEQFTMPCTGDPPDGMSCVESVPFLLGDMDSLGVDSDYPPQPEVLRRPIFSQFLDLDEVTVGAVRPFIRSQAIRPGAVQRRGDPGVPDSCTFLGSNDAANDALPLNCISRDGAVDACVALGKLLPPEWLWELAARNGVRETRYPWGDDPPDCKQAVVSADPSCPRKGPQPIDSSPTPDVTSAGFRNLGGNLSEWVDGVFVPYSDPCWQDTTDDQTCADDSRYFNWTGPWPHRGGSWDRRASSAASFARFASPDGGPSPSIGFRCAVSTPL